MQLLVDFIQEILLDDGVHHDGNEEIEEHSWNILPASRVEGCVLEYSRLYFHRGSHVVMQGDEEREAIGLETWNMRPTTKTMATQATMSAWFWITNSWLRTGGFFFFPLATMSYLLICPTVSW